MSEEDSELEVTKSKSKSKSKNKSKNKSKSKSALDATSATDSQSESTSKYVSTSECTQPTKRKREGNDTPPAKRFKTNDGESIPGTLRASEYRQLHKIAVRSPSGRPVLDPIQRFEDTSFPVAIMRSIAKMGFSSPSPVQAQVWPIGTATCDDVVAIARTGSGKTLAFLLPAFVHVLEVAPGKAGPAPSVLVVAPTRELAMQIFSECQRFATPCNISAVCVYGGVPKKKQRARLVQGVHVVVATPGRLLDFTGLGPSGASVTSLANTSFVVLDEADRLLDMGFEQQIRDLLSMVRPQRRTLMFSATWPKGVRDLASEFMNAPVHVTIGTGSDKPVVNPDVEQHVHNVPRGGKVAQLMSLMTDIKSREGDVSVIIFANKKKHMERIESIAKECKFKCGSISGDKRQFERTAVLSRFVSGRYNVLVATDVAARGLDIKGVSHVISYDFPPSGVADWIHRVGRTGRAGSSGVAHTFFCIEDDSKNAGELTATLDGAQQDVPQWLRDLSTTTRPKKARWNKSKQDRRQRIRGPTGEKVEGYVSD